MKTKKRMWKMMSAIMTLVIMAGVNVSCSEDDSLEPSVGVGEIVTDFQKSVRYEETKQFQTDMDALTALTFDIEGIRWAWWRMVSNDFKNGLSDFFSVPLDETGMHTPDMLEAFNKILGHAIENCDTYDEALRNMSASGVLPPLDDEYQTRGKLGSSASLGLVIKECGVLSRQTVMAVLSQGGWATDSRKLNEFYYALPSEDRAGYKDPYTFWSDFSKGKLDQRAGQVYVNLYYLKPLDFGLQSRDMKLTPWGNTNIMAHKLAEAGQNLVLDAHPGLKIFGIGKDANETIESSLKLLKTSVNATGSTDMKDYEDFAGALGGFMMQMGHNVANYGPDFYKWQKDARATWDIMGHNNLSLNDATHFDKAEISKMLETLFTVGAETYDFAKDEMMLSDHLITTLFDKGKKLGLKVQITFQNAGGDKYPMVILTDMKTGEVRVGYTFDENGNVIMLPGQGGLKKTVTTVNKKTHRVVKKDIIVNANDSTIVEFGLDDDDKIMEEIPEYGELYVNPKSLNFTAIGGRLTTMIVTNYLYYKAIPDNDWIKCTLPSDFNQLTVRVVENPDFKPRTGSVTVVATDSKGKVLKSAVLKVTQDAKEPDAVDFISAEPQTVEFDAEGGTKDVEITLQNGLKTWSAYVEDEAIGWMSADPYEYIEEEGLWKGIGHNRVKIKVNPNTTGEERRGIITAIASREDDVFAAEKNNQTVNTDILVIQKAAEEQPGVDKIVKCEIDIDQIYLKWKSSKPNNPHYEWRGDIWYSAIYELLEPTMSDENIKVTMTKNTWHVSTFYKDSEPINGKPGKYTLDNKISFDIDGVDKGFEQSVVNNVKLDIKVIIHDEPNKGSYPAKLEASNIKFVKVEKRRYNLYEPEPKYHYIYTFEGTTADGLSLTYEDYDYILEKNPDNKVIIKVTVLPAIYQ